MSNAISTSPLARLLSASTAASRAVAQLRGDLQQIREAQTTCRELRRAHRIIATEGLSLPFLAYLSTTNFRKVAQHFPAVETVDVVGIPASDSRVQRGLAQLQAVVSDEAAVLHQQVKSLSQHVAALLDAAGEQAQQFTALAAQYRGQLETARLEVPALATVQTHAVALEALSAQVKGLIEAERQLAAPSYDVKTPKLDQLVTTALETVFADLRPFTGVALEAFVASPDLARLEEPHTPTTASLQEKGYEPRAMLALLSDAETLAGGLTRLAQSKDAILMELANGNAAILGEEDDEMPEVPAEGEEGPTLASEALDVNRRLDTHRLCLAGFASTLALTLDTAAATLSDVVRMADEIIVVTVDPEEDTEGENEQSNPDAPEENTSDDEGAGDDDGYPLI